MNVPYVSLPMATASAADLRFEPRREAWVLAGIVALAAAVRILRWQGLAVMFNDGPIFLALAEAIESGLPDQALAHPFHPLYSALVAGVHGPIANWETAAVFVSIACGSLAVGVLYLFVRDLHGRAAAWIAALLFAVHPGAIEYTGDIQSEGAYLFFFVSAACLLWRGLRSERPLLALAGGLAAGLAYLARPEGLGIALVAGGLAVFEGWKRGAPLGRSILLAGAIGLGGALVVGPYVGFLHAQTGEWTFTQKKSMAVMAGLEAPPRDGPNPVLPKINRAGRPAESRLVSPKAQLEARLPEELRAAAAERYAEAVFDVVRTHLRALRYEGVALLLAGLALGGLGRAGPRARFIGGVVAAYAVVLLLLAANVGYVSGRHALPPLILTLGYVAGGVMALGQWAGRRFGKATGHLVLAALLALVTGIGLGKALPPDRGDSRAARIAAEWLGSQDIPVRGLAARKRRIAYYAGAPFVKIHAQERSAGKIWTRGASHLILNHEADHYPILRESLPTEAVLLHRVESPAPGASVYELPMPERFRKRKRYRERNLIDAAP
ncbi:MAG: glycosyltransferase family 39 protein [Deltaproteobacteria bacterium]|nr:glycosyltransferase family 39 protein [Deltaproteobacteria bacterium]MBW2394260.1 glycosyltransferase family 39 protein [Deltaproteobacteria bacterium]